MAETKTGKQADPMAAAPAAKKPAAAAPPLVKFKINGRSMEVPAGTSIIEAAHRAGIPVPYFCYHPGLTPAGNCRMCLVEVSNSRKPVASCVTPVAEGTEVFTESKMAKEAREGVLELMLVNHPLDCPICDKSGECLLQDHAYDHGPDSSRMVEPKVIKPTKDVGSNIIIWGNRCIVCTRCVRFCDEVSGTGELCVVERADHSVVDVFPGYPLENPLATNTVDICPVGALISKDFLYQARVWNMRRTPSICAGCARGCSVEVQSSRNEVKRLVPRHNPQVNDYWMCDHGRFDFKYIAADSRRLDYSLPAREAGAAPSARPADAGAAVLRGLQEVIARHGPGSIAGIGSAFMTIEELYLLRVLLEKLGSEKWAAAARPAGAEERFKKFTISGDKNPNRAGVERILGGGALDEKLARVREGMRKGEIRAALFVSDLPHRPLDDELAELLGRLEFAAVFLLDEDPRLPGSAALLPATAFAEKNGAMINEDGQLQRLQAAVQPPKQVRYELDILQEMLVALGERPQALSSAGVFLQAVERFLPEIQGATHRSLGGHGVRIPGFRKTAPAKSPAGEGAKR